MNLETFREYCLAKKGVTEELPFGPETLVFKVMGKMFSLTSLDSEVFRFNLKNTPEKNEELRAEYESIIPGYHMNKLHWNTIFVNQSIKETLLRELIDESYELIVKSLTKKIQEELNKL
jgi:predicted DNA-binding protein (MmcQ/YjbR family)